MRNSTGKVTRTQLLKLLVSPQNDNVLFAQSRNVLLTPSGWGGGRRTTTDDASRTGPPGGPEEGEEEADHPEAGSRRAGDHRTARETVAPGVEATRRQGRGSRPARDPIEPQAQCGDRTRGSGGFLSGGGVRGWGRTWGGGTGPKAQKPGESGEGE